MPPGIFDPTIEQAPPADLRQLQLERLRWAVAYAYERVPFYRERFRAVKLQPPDVQRLEDVRRIPFTTKEDLRAGYPFGLAAVPPSQLAEVHASSGTTGAPALNLYTPRDLSTWGEVMARCLTMSGLTKGDVLQITPSFGMFTGGFGFFYGARRIGCFIVPTGAGFSRRQVQFMRDFGTTMICAVVSYALRLSETAREMGLDPAQDTRVRKGVLGSEVWTDAMRSKIASTWDMDVYDIYGFTELCGPGVANDCFRHDGLHVWQDHFLTEVVDPVTGEALEPEQEGELVFSTLTKEGMPLLRFRSRDLARLYAAGSCDCGRTHQRISRIRGRLDDALKVRGTMVWPSSVEGLLLKEPNLGAEYQLRVTRLKGLDQLRILVEARDALAPDQRANIAHRLAQELHDRLMVESDVEILGPGALPRSEVGKAKRVVDDREFA